MTPSAASSPSAPADTKDTLSSHLASTRRPSRRRARGSSEQGGSRRGRRFHGGAPAPKPAVPPPDLPWIHVDAQTAPIPFSTLGLDRRLARGLTDLGFEGTRPVQGVVIPLAIEGL